MKAAPICVDGLVDVLGLDGETELSACHGCPGCAEIVDRHTLSCSLWLSPDPEIPRDCGALVELAAPVVAAYRGGTA